MKELLDIGNLTTIDMYTMVKDCHHLLLSQPASFMHTPGYIGYHGDDLLHTLVR